MAAGMGGCLWVSRRAEERIVIDVESHSRFQKQHTHVHDKYLFSHAFHQLLNFLYQYALQEQE